MKSDTQGIDEIRNTSCIQKFNAKVVNSKILTNHIKEMEETNLIKIIYDAIGSEKRRTSRKWP